MLGGSFWLALLRNTISAGLMLSFFLMLDRPRFSMKKTTGCYIAFGASLVTAYSLWYLFEIKALSSMRRCPRCRLSGYSAA